jgi:hypothetical protein
MDNLQLNSLCEYEEKLTRNMLLDDVTEKKDEQQYNDYINKINNKLNNFIINFDIEKK